MTLFERFEAERIARGEDYVVTIEDVRSFLSRHVYNDPETIRVDGAVASVLWSFQIDRATTETLSLTLARQSGDKIRAIGSTPAGEFMLAVLSADYERNRDFGNFPIEPDGSDDFWSRISRFFVENTDHPLITLTPRGLASSVYGVTEVKAIAANPEIEVINGTARSEIGFNLFSSSEAAQKAYLTAIFNGDFSGDLIASNSTTIWRVGDDDDDDAEFYFDFDDATKEALGIAGITFDPLPSDATPAVSQQEIREDVLGAYVRGRSHFNRFAISKLRLGGDAAVLHL